MAEQRKSGLDYVLGTLLVLLGALLLADRWLGLSVWSAAWPLFVLAPGVALLVLVLAGPRGFAVLAVPGSVLVTLGVVLMVLNSSGQWQIWAYAWALVIPASVGAGLMAYGRRSGRRSVWEAGANATKVGLILFLVFGGVFELVLGLSDLPGRAVLWPILLILLGVLVLVEPIWRRFAR
ncbi:MAG: hypothetical protein Kow00129_03480 [Thermoleophilia bacterium]